MKIITTRFIIILIGACLFPVVYASSFFVQQTTALFFPAQPQTATAVNTINSSVSGTLTITEEIPVGTTVTGSFYVLDSSVTLTNTSNPAYTGTLDIFTPTVSAPTPFSLVGNSPTRTSAALTIKGQRLRLPANSIAGNYVGSIRVQVTDNAGNSGIIPLTAQFSFMPAASIATQSGMVFPATVVGSSQVNIILPATSPGAAIFSAYGGTPGRSYTLSVLQSTVNLTSPGTASTVQVFGFTFGGSATSAGAITFPSSGTPMVSNIRLGATARYPANLPGGTYTGTNTLQIVY